MFNKWRIGAALLVMCFYSSGTVVATEEQIHLNHQESKLLEANRLPLHKIPLDLKKEISNDNRIIDIKRVSGMYANDDPYAALTSEGQVVAWGSK